MTKIGIIALITMAAACSTMKSPHKFLQGGNIEASLHDSSGIDTACDDTTEIKDLKEQVSGSEKWIVALTGEVILLVIAFMIYPKKPKQ